MRTSNAHASGAADSRSEARAEQLSCLSRVPWYIFLVLHLLGLPGGPMFQHRIEHGHIAYAYTRSGRLF